MFPEKVINIYKLNDNIDTIVFIDENNSGILEKILRDRKNGIEINEEDRFFVLTGCIISKKQYDLLNKRFDKLKNKLWKNGKYFNEKQQKEYKVCFHSSDIRRKVGCFQEKIVNHSILCQEINNIISNIDFKIISVVIDVNSYVKTQKSINVYNSAMEIITREVIKTVNKNQKVAIVLEARGKKEDNEVYQYMQKCIAEQGIGQHSKETLQKYIQGIYFNTKHSNGGKKTCSGIELADLCSYPIFKYIKTGQKDIAFKIIENKLII